MKHLLVVIVLLTATYAQAVDTDRDSFDLGCLSWDQVQETFDLSQISSDERALIRATHTNARIYLTKANSNFQVFSEAEMETQKIMLCSLVDEATHGFEYNCLNDKGEELISEGLIENCLSMRLANLTNS